MNNTFTTSCHLYLVQGTFHKVKIDIILTPFKSKTTLMKRH